jgi:L-ribulose-5-phosphate 3-epimerase
MTTRRGFLRTAAGLAAATAGARLAQAQEPRKLRIGMCDWNLRKQGNVEAVALAKQIGLDGIQVSIEFPEGSPHLRGPELQKRYLDAGRAQGIAFPSTALGVLNGVPLKSEPKAAIWVADAIPATAKLGAHVILLAFFGKGELNMADEEGITRVVDVLKELAPRAAEAGVVLGLENTLSAEDNLTIIGRVGSPAVRVYYDLRNSADQGRDVPAEIRRLGDQICEVHLKNGNKLLRDRENVDFPACAAALKEIGYKGWHILETAAPTDLVADTRANIEYVRATFG